MSISTDYLALVTGFAVSTGEPIAPLKAQVDTCIKLVGVVSLNPNPPAPTP